MWTMSALLKQWFKSGWKVENKSGAQCHVWRVLVTYDLTYIMLWGNKMQCKNNHNHYAGGKRRWAKVIQVEIDVASELVEAQIPRFIKPFFCLLVLFVCRIFPSNVILFFLANHQDGDTDVRNQWIGVKRALRINYRVSARRWWISCNIQRVWDILNCINHLLGGNSSELIGVCDRAGPTAFLRNASRFLALIW